MQTPMAGSLLAVLNLFSLLLPATAQTFSSCNPLQQGGCPADPALGRSVDIDFSSGASGDFTAAGAVSYTSDGAAFTISQHGDAPTLQSKWYIMFGHVDFVVKAAPGTGIVSAAVLQSDCLDEIDWEWLGGDDTQAQSNYFGKGITTTGYNRGAYHGAANNHDEFHIYSIDWTADQIVWSIDGQTVRAMSESQAEAGQYPQTPMFVKLGAWAGGDPSNPQGTIQWAGGATDYSAGPYTMYVKSVHVTDYSTGSQYTYSGTSGTWQSITSSGGQINSEGNGVPASAGSAPAVTSSVPNSGAPLAFGNGDDSSSVTATRTGWPWSGTATATIVSVLTSTSPLPSPFSSAVLSSAAASASASFEITTSYDQQGFPTVVTLSPTPSTTPLCFNNNGFPTSCAATVVPASNQGSTTQAPAQPSVTTSGSPNSATAAPSSAAVGASGGASSVSASSPAASESTATGIAGNTVANPSSTIASTGGSSSGTQPAATATSGVSSASGINQSSATPTTEPQSTPSSSPLSLATGSQSGSGINTASVALTSSSVSGSNSATASQTVITSNGSTFTLSITSTTIAGSTTTSSSTRPTTTLATSGHTSSRESTTSSSSSSSASSSSTASSTPPAPNGSAAIHSAIFHTLTSILVMCTVVFLI